MGRGKISDIFRAFLFEFFFLFSKFVCCKFPVFRRFKNRFETLVKVYMEIASVWLCNLSVIFWVYLKKILFLIFSLFHRD